MPACTKPNDGTARLAADLVANGYAIVRDALPPALIAEIDKDFAAHFARTPFGCGAFYGATTKRFGRLLLRSPHAAALVQHPLILGAIETVLAQWCDCIQLNTTQAIGIHPGAPAQLPHRDQDMWRAPAGEAEDPGRRFRRCVHVAGSGAETPSGYLSGPWVLSRAR